LLRESYRLNKLSLADKVMESDLNVKILFTLSSGGFEKYLSLDFQKINISMIALMEKINIYLTNQ